MPKPLISRWADCRVGFTVADHLQIEHTGHLVYPVQRGEFARYFRFEKPHSLRITSGMGKTDFDSDTWQKLRNAIRAGKAAVVAKILAKKPEFAHVTEMGSCLHLAADCGRLEIVKQFLDAGAEVDSVEDEEWGAHRSMTLRPKGTLSL